MKILLDTDILLDVALERAQFFEKSAAVLEWAEKAPGQACVAWHSLSNISYLVRPDARKFIKDLLRFVSVAPGNTDAALQALDFPMSDFEDALQAAAAMAFGSTFVVTRNLSHYRNSPVPAVSPAQFLAKLDAE